MILRNGTVIEADFVNDRIVTPLTNDMTSMLAIELPEIVSKTPIPSGRKFEIEQKIKLRRKLNFHSSFEYIGSYESYTK